MIDIFDFFFNETRKPLNPIQRIRLKNAPAPWHREPELKSERRLVVAAPAPPLSPLCPDCPVIGDSSPRLGHRRGHTLPSGLHTWLKANQKKMKTKEKKRLRCVFFSFSRPAVFGSVAGSVVFSSAPSVLTPFFAH